MSGPRQIFHNFFYVDGGKINCKYTILPMNSVRPSHIGISRNPDYGIPELQNRASRGTVHDQHALQQLAYDLQPEKLGPSVEPQTGAPIVNEDGDVIAGNGRFEILRITPIDQFQRYHTYLKSLGFHSLKYLKYFCLGQDAFAKKEYSRPILVRQVKGLSKQKQIEIAEASNVPTIFMPDHASQARLDAKILGEMPHSAAEDGPNAFLHCLPPETRAGLILNNGQPDMITLERRFFDALIMWLCDRDTRWFDVVYLCGRLGRRVINALTEVLPELFDFERRYPKLQLSPHIRRMLDKAGGSLKRADFSENLLQQNIFADNMDFIDASLMYLILFGSYNQIVEFFTRYIRFAAENSAPGLFRNTTLSEMIHQALQCAFAEMYDRRGNPVDDALILVYTCPRPQNDAQCDNDEFALDWAGAADAEEKRKYDEQTREKARVDSEAMRLAIRLAREDRRGRKKIIDQAKELQKKLYPDKTLSQIYGEKIRDSKSK